MEDYNIIIIRTIAKRMTAIYVQEMTYIYRFGSRVFLSENKTDKTIDVIIKSMARNHCCGILTVS